MARRGFLAEWQHQARLAERERERSHRAAVQAHNAAVRRAEQAQRQAERAEARLARATDAERKQIEKEARAAHLAAMEAEVEERNAVLAEIYDDVDSLLEATLRVDDFVDLESMRGPAVHPPFDRTDLEAPVPPPTPVSEPRKPVYWPPEPPSGLRAVFGDKKHARAVAAAEAAHRQLLREWRAEVERIEQEGKEAAEAHGRADAERLAKLQAERERYSSECATRDELAEKRNLELQGLIANLGYGTPEAIQEYVSIVLSNSVYPEHFRVSHDFTFDRSTAELVLKAVVPPPDKVPTIKAYKYNKSSEEIAYSQLPLKDCRERYSKAVQHVAIRSIHEIFEAERRGLIETISLEVGTNATDPATGRERYVPFVAVGAERDSFLRFDLTEVVAASTLAHLGASVSKDPYKLVPADTGGIRRI